jgi:hypothetical protein
LSGTLGDKGSDAFSAVAGGGIEDHHVQIGAAFDGEGREFQLDQPDLGVAPAHFGWLGMFAGLDLAASGAITRARLGWQPTGPGLIEHLKKMDYAVPATVHV